MVIALDVATVSASSNASTLQWSHTVGSGSNLLLVVGICCHNTSSTPTVSGVTYAGTAMTKAQAYTRTSGAVRLESSVWILASPSTGANDIIASITNYGYSGGVSASYTGCSQTSIADAYGGKTGITTGSVTFTVTTVADNCWIFAIGTNESTTDQTIAANQTSRGTLLYHASGGSGIARLRSEDTNAAQTPAGSKTLGFTLGYPMDYAFCAASFAPAAASGVSIINLMTLDRGIDCGMSLGMR
jgi:hypothetical protein